MKSAFLTLKSRDFWKGLIMAILTAILTASYQLFSTSTDFKTMNWQFIGVSAGAAFIGYITKNFLTNSNGQILTKEPS